MNKKRTKGIIIYILIAIVLIILAEIVNDKLDLKIDNIGAIFGFSFSIVLAMSLTNKKKNIEE